MCKAGRLYFCDRFALSKAQLGSKKVQVWSHRDKRTFNTTSTGAQFNLSGNDPNLRTKTEAFVPERSKLTTHFVQLLGPLINLVCPCVFLFMLQQAYQMAAEFNAYAVLWHDKHTDRSFSCEYKS